MFSLIYGKLMNGATSLIMMIRNISQHPQSWKQAEYSPLPLTSHPRRFVCKSTGTAYSNFSHLSHSNHLSPSKQLHQFDFIMHLSKTTMKSQPVWAADCTFVQRQFKFLFLQRLCFHRLGSWLYQRK